MPLLAIEIDPRHLVENGRRRRRIYEIEAAHAWLSEHRRARTQSIIERLRQAKRAGELAGHVDEIALGDCCAALLHGLSVQARDGVSAHRLSAMVDAFLEAFDLKTTRPRRSSHRAPNRKLSRQ
jgi:hypothetical protein